MMTLGLMLAAATVAWQVDGLLPELKGDVKINSADYVLPASLADEPEPDAKVVYVDGLPKVSLNGRLLEPTFNQSDIDPLPRVNAAIKAASLGLTINQLIIRAAWLEQSPGVYDFARLDEHMRRLLRFCPEGRAILSLRLEIPQWLAQHPEEAIAYATGPVDRDRNDDRLGRPFRPSAASKAYRAEICRFLRLFADYVKAQPWGKRLIAVRPCWGIYTEWHTYGFYEGPDVGPAMTAAFRAYKGGKYANESLPTWDERLAKPGTYALDPVRDAKVIDYYQCQQEVVSDYLLEVSHQLKTLLPGRLVGAYYGYVFTTHPAEGSNVMLDKVLSSPDIDFLSDPSAYSPASRLAGGSYYHRTVPSTFHRHKKLSVIEDDMRHFVIREQVSHKNICTRSPREAEMTMRRNWVNMYFDGCGIQILDPEGGDRSKRPFSFDMPEVWRAMRDSQRALRAMGARPESSGNGTAVVVDWRERLKRAWKGDAKGNNIYVRSIEGLYASGVPVDLMTLDDFLAQPAGRYPRAVFMNLFNPEPEMKSALDRKLADEGIRSVAFLRTPGVDVATTGTAWRELLVGLGERPLAPADHYVRRHGDVVLFHTGKTGTWELDLPFETAVTEVFSGRRYGPGRFSVTTDGPDTLVFVKAKDLDHSKFHIGALCFGETLCDDAHVKELVDCGIDNVQGTLSDDAKDFLAKYGVAVRGGSPIPGFWGPGVYGRMKPGERHGDGQALEKKIPFGQYEKAAESYRPRPNEWSYTVGDEMSNREFPYLARVVNLLRETHPDCEPHINHHPCWQRGKRVEWHLGTNYVDMIRDYCRTVPTDYVSYDFYLYEYGLKDANNAANNLRLRDYGTARYLDNLRIVADACRDYGRMFDFIAGVNAQQQAFEVTEQMIRYQAYTAMAFGVQKLYWACWEKGWWHRNVLDTNGVRTVQYDRLRTVNRELRSFCDAYIRYRWVGSRFTGFTGRAANWVAPSPDVYYPQQNVNADAPLSTVFFTEIAAQDGLPLIVSDFEPRVPDRSRGLFICAADDPWDENPVERTVRFRTPRRVRVFGGAGEIPCEKDAEGFYSVRVRSNAGVFVIGR